jgi:peroxiredoxin Q/BCP
MLKAGQLAPVIELPDASLEMLDLASFRGRNTVVLFFYPRDRAPQCIQEAIEFSDLDEVFAHHGAVLLGISRDNFLSHAAFREEHGLAAQLLSDEDGEVCRRYGVLAESQVNGVLRSQVERVTYIIDRDGMVCHVVPVQHAKGHAAEVLKLVKEMK